MSGDIEDESEPDLMSVEIPWPVANDVLVAGGPDWRLNAAVGWQLGDWYSYASGYKTAAEILSTHVEAVGRDQDVLLWPFVMCWRHHIELLLKTLLVVLQNLHDESPVLMKTHSIDLIWQKVKPLLKSVSDSDGEPPEDVENVDHVIKQLHAIDGNGEPFRYPVNNSGVSHVFSFRIVNIPAFNASMSRISSYLDAAYNKLSNDLDFKWEFESEMESCYGGDY